MWESRLIQQMVHLFLYLINCYFEKLYSIYEMRLLKYMHEIEKKANFELIWKNFSSSIKQIYLFPLIQYLSMALTLIHDESFIDAKSVHWNYVLYQLRKCELLVKNQYNIVNYNLISI